MKFEMPLPAKSVTKAARSIINAAFESPAKVSKNGGENSIVYSESLRLETLMSEGAKSTKEPATNNSNAFAFTPRTGSLNVTRHLND